MYFGGWLSQFLQLVSIWEIIWSSAANEQNPVFLGYPSRSAKRQNLVPECAERSNSWAEGEHQKSRILSRRRTSEVENPLFLEGDSWWLKTKISIHVKLFWHWNFSIGMVLYINAWADLGASRRRCEGINKTIENFMHLFRGPPGWF